MKTESNWMRRAAHGLGTAFLLMGVLRAVPATAETGADAELREKIDQVAKKALAEHGIPSASIAVVKDGHLAFTGAYGSAGLEPQRPARTEMRYCIGSISKQFTAAAILLLAEQGKLSLDDRVDRFLPSLSGADEVSIRMLLSHTSGYRDYWPQDYVMAPMQKPVTTDEILARWARAPLDFAPGTKWQYSNTNYVIAGLIIEKASGMPFMRFLAEKVLEPLGLRSAIDLTQRALEASDAAGYLRHGLGPHRPAAAMGKGWLYATGELAMSAADLARWDMALLERRLLKPASYAALFSEVQLKSGIGTRYGLGLQVGLDSERRMLRHRGEVSGFTASNLLFPDDRAAIVVLTNQDAASADEVIAMQIKSILFAEDAAQAEKAQARDRQIFVGLSQGRINRALLSDNANHYFSEQALKDFAAGLAPLGMPLEFKETAHKERGGMLLREYKVKLQSKTLRVWSRELPGGKLEEFLVASAPPA